MALPYETHGYFYMLTAVLGPLLSFYIIFKDGRKKELARWDLIIVYVLVILFGMVGANIFYHFIPWTHAKAWTDFSFAKAAYNFIMFKGGLVWYGGFTFGILTVLVYCRARKLDFWKYADSFMVGTFFGLAISRIGCFLAGCCRGIESTLPWAIERFGTTIHPTQLYLSLNAIFVGIILYELNRRRKFDGYIFMWAMVLYPLTRFFIEFLRGYHVRVFGVFTASQLISLLILCVSVPLLIYHYKRFK